jgi:hypothetical protein
MRGTLTAGVSLWQNEARATSMGTVQQQQQLVKEEPMDPSAQDSTDPFPSGAQMEAEVTVPDVKKKRKRAMRKRKPVEKRDKAHQCFLCDKDYMYKGHLQRHITTEHHICFPTGQEKCRFCGAIFSSHTFEEHKVTSDHEIKKFFEKYEISEEKQQNLMKLWNQYKEVTEEEKDTVAA